MFCHVFSAWALFVLAARHSPLERQGTAGLLGSPASPFLSPLGSWFPRRLRARWFDRSIAYALYLAFGSDDVACCGLCLGDWPRDLFYRRPKPANCPTWRWSPARPFCRFVPPPGEGGTAQGRSRTEHKIKINAECRRVCLFPTTTVPAAVWLFCRGPKHTTDDTTTTTTRGKKMPRRARSRAPSRAWNVRAAVDHAVDMAGLWWCSSPRARARSCGASRREAQGRLKHKPPQRGVVGCGLVCVARFVVYQALLLRLVRPFRPPRSSSTSSVVVVVVHPWLLHPPWSIHCSSLRN